MSVTKFTVYEDRWLCGSIPHEGDQSRLLSSQSGKMCCMGFLAEACGVPREARLDSPFFTNYRMVPHDGLLPAALRPRLDEHTNDPRGHGDLAHRIYHTNDATQLDHEERKDRLRHLFAEAGVEVVFVKETPGE